MQATSTEALFSSALALPLGERSAFLLKACATDDERMRVEELLRAEAGARSFITEPLKADAAGDALGDYRLLHELGEGGCGVVYLAEQQSPVKREVALKIIKLGMDTKALIRRFEAERQALAMMDHPHIAKVFDAGATSTGRPYFVMELVRGIKITEYSEQCRLSLDERLELFIQVCQAIQHAHLKGVIHRDIKPSNVLVTLHDGKPIVKVIDFGVAKAMQGRLTDVTLHTLVGQFIGTPAYMSPEQTEPGAQGVDTRSDIYTLGVLLYELLTGCTPVGADSAQLSLDRMRRRIRGEDPAPPSKRTRTSAASATPDSAARPAAGRAFRRGRGDLDWIAMRCLEKERERRYQTVGELIADLRRFLGNHPVAARPRTLTYAVAKFARRHRAAFASAVAIAIALGGATTVSAWQAWRALQAEKLAKETIQALANVYSAADPFSHPHADDMTREMLDRAAQAARNDLQQYPEVKAELLESVGRIHRRRREMDRALPLLQEAVRLRREASAPDTTAFLNAMHELAIALMLAADLESAERVIDEAIDSAKRASMEQSLPYAQLMHRRGVLAKETGDIAQALADLEDALALKRRLLGPEHVEIGISLISKAGALIWTDELAAAETNAREAVAVLRSSTPPLHPERLAAEAVLGAALHYQERYVESDAIFIEVLRNRTEVYGRDSIPVASILDFLGQSAAALGRMDQAEGHARDVVRIHEGIFGPDHVTTALYRVSLADILARRRTYGEGEEQVRRALGSYSRSASTNDQHLAAAEYILGEILLNTGRAAEAEVVLTTSIRRWERARAPAWRAARSAGALSQALFDQGRVSEAERFILDYHRAVFDAVGPDEYTRELMRNRIRKLAAASERIAQLRELLALPQR